MLGDEHTCVKKRMFWSPRSSRTMSFGDKTASWPAQGSSIFSSVDRTGYLVPEVMLTPVGIPLSYASAQEDRMLSLGHPDLDYPSSSPPHYHGRASLFESKPALANRSSWCVLDGDPMGDRGGRASQARCNDAASGRYAADGLREITECGSPPTAEGWPFASAVAPRV